MPARGWLAILEYVWAAAAAFVGAASAWALWMRAPAAVPLARMAIVVAAIREIQRLIWTALPFDVIPGTRKWVAVLICLASLMLSGAAQSCASDRTREPHSRT